MNLGMFSDVWVAENQVSRSIVFHDEKETGGNKNSRVKACLPRTHILEHIFLYAYSCAIFFFASSSYFAHIS